MSYAGTLSAHDADAHIMETPELLRSFADPAIRELMTDQTFAGLVGGEGSTGQIAELRAAHVDPTYRERDQAELMSRKNWAATGSFIKEDRPKALDLLGFKSQLMFNTFWSGYLLELERTGDIGLLYGAARAHNRAMLDFCSVDKRLLPTCYVPLVDFAAAEEVAAQAIRDGAKALLIPSACPPQHSPSHVSLFGVWRLAEESGVPIVMHVGGGGELLHPSYFTNGMPPVKDFHGGAENFRSVDYMAIPVPPAQTLATLLIDGVLEQFPTLKIGIIEQGAVWIPSFMRQLESAFEAFRRHEDRLQALSLRPSEYIQRQVRATPYPTEDVGWIMAQGCEDICMFSSDYPHVEGGRNPIKRFEAHLADTSALTRQKFYHDNFVDLMGSALDA